MYNKQFSTVGKSVMRIDAADKAYGRVKFTGDIALPGILHAELHTSEYAHATIQSIDVTEAWRAEGVKAIITGDAFPFPVGPMLADRPPLVIDKVRYYGEPIAIVVASNRRQAKMAASLIKVNYDPLPVINSPRQAFTKGSPLIHEKLGDYKI